MIAALDLFDIWTWIVLGVSIGAVWLMALFTHYHWIRKGNR